MDEPKPQIVLSPIERICTGAVIGDTVDQLAILGRIMPSSYEGRPDAAKIVQDEISEIVESQKRLESQFEILNMQLAELKGAGAKGKDKLAVAKNDLQEILEELKGSNVTFSKSLQQSPLSPDNLAKMQDDREFAEKTLQQSLVELFSSGTFEYLTQSVAVERDKRTALQRTVKKEDNGRKTIRRLQEDIKNVKKEKENELQRRNEMIAHLKDQLQEMKAKTSMEKNYVKKVTEVNVVQTKKMCDLSIKELQDEIQSLKNKLAEEERVNSELESFLRTKNTELSEKLDYWSQTYDKDLEEKKRELENLKTKKSQDLTKLQELTKTYQEYEEVVVEDRIEKEKARRLAEQMAEELKSCNRIQAWWRGCMVRNQIGPYGKKKKGKKGKGKKSGKKSGKKGKKK